MTEVVSVSQYCKNSPVKLLPGLGGVCLEIKVIFDKKKRKSIKNYFLFFKTFQSLSNFFLPVIKYLWLELLCLFFLRKKAFLVGKGVVVDMI